MPNSDQDMVYRFFKPGFCEHQSDKLIPAVNRKAILLDKNFACHPKVTLLAKKRDPVPFFSTPSYLEPSRSGVGELEHADGFLRALGTDNI